LIVTSRPGNRRSNLRRASGLALASSFVIVGCVVSFDDYPVGELEGSTAKGGSGAVGNGSGAVGNGSSTGGTGIGAVGNGSGAVGNESGAAGDGSGGSDTTGSGGADGGAGGEAGEGADTPSIPIDLIDDFEDGNAAILPNDGREGKWYVMNDGSGTQKPSAQDTIVPPLLDAPRGKSKRALHTVGGGFFAWGAYIRANLRTGMMNNVPYDASRYTGVRFFARSGDGDKHSAIFMLPTVGTSCPGCTNHFGTKFEYSSEWQEYFLPFNEMKQQGFGMPGAKLKPKEIVAVQVQFDNNVDFDLWIDDIGFY
jgi:hypothetical protein